MTHRNPEFHQSYEGTQKPLVDPTTLAQLISIRVTVEVRVNLSDLQVLSLLEVYGAQLKFQHRAF